MSVLTVGYMLVNPIAHETWEQMYPGRCDSFSEAVWQSVLHAFIGRTSIDLRQSGPSFRTGLVSALLSLRKDQTRARA